MNRLIGFMFRRLWVHRKYSSGILLSMVVSLSLTTMFSLSFKVILNGVTGHSAFRLAPFAYAFAIGFMLYFGAQILSNYWMSEIGKRIENDLRLDMFSVLQQLPLSYYQNTDRGSLTSRFTTDLQNMEYFALTVVPSIYAVFSVIVTLVIIAVLRWEFAVLSLLAVAFSVLLPAWINRKAATSERNLKIEYSELNSYVQEHLTIHKMVRAYNLKAWEYNRLKERSTALLPGAVRSIFETHVSPLAVTLSLLFFNIIATLVGSWLALKGFLSIGTLVAFESLFLTMSQQVRELSKNFPFFTLASTSYSRIERLLKEKLEEPRDLRERQVTDFRKIRQGISFQKVSFSYSEDQPILQDLTFTANMNRYIAIIGRNGSGKSTVVNLLMRFYEPTGGSVEFDGTDAGQIPLEALRNLIGYVSQDAELMNLSIFDNIRLGRLEATEEEVYAAASLAGIHDWIVKLPSGYETNCGEDGQILSGGQRQRIAIARALVRDPDILLFDEVTSALDPENEMLIHETIGKLAKNKTVIHVTHRLALARNADDIILMDGGKAACIGRHDDLIRQNELYQMMWDKQNGFAISGDGRNANIDAHRLREIPLFYGLDADFLQYICDCLGTEYMNPGELVVEQGGHGDKLYIIVRGMVEVLKWNQNEGEVRAAVLEDGDHFGEVSLMMSVPRTATIRTLTPCTFLTIHRNLFQSILDKAAPELRLRLEQSCRERFTD